jgi:hypothetical protein
VYTGATGELSSDLDAFEERLIRLLTQSGGQPLDNDNRLEPISQMPKWDDETESYPPSYTTAWT